MPIARWICAACGGREVPLTHFAETECGEKVHPDYCAAILKDRSEQYVEKAVRVSHGLGCPRKAAIEESEDFAVDPLDINAMLTGTAWHACVETAGPLELCEVQVSGTINGIIVNGKLDRLRQLYSGDWCIEDWKHINDFNAKYVRERPKPEHVAQISLYAELVDQTMKIRPKFGIVWYHGSTAGKDALIPHKVELFPLHETLAFEPYGCGFTVLQLLTQAMQHYEEGWKWQEMPMVGQSIKFGTKTGCDYCAVRSTCWTAEKGAPF